MTTLNHGQMNALETRLRFGIDALQRHYNATEDSRPAWLPKNGAAKQGMLGQFTAHVLGARIEEGRNEAADERAQAYNNRLKYNQFNYRAGLDHALSLGLTREDSAAKVNDIQKLVIQALADNGLELPEDEMPEVTEVSVLLGVKADKEPRQPQAAHGHSF